MLAKFATPFLGKAGLALSCLAIGLGAGLTVTKAGAQDQRPKQTVADFPDLRKGLLETPGCQGVEVAKIGEKLCIFSWFENRKAVEAWYYGKMHTDAMKKFFPDFKQSKPFAKFKDEKAPIMVIASVTPGNPAGGAGNLAVSQIAIEGYTPVSGGLSIGGSFAPEKFKVPDMVRLSGK